MLQVVVIPLYCALLEWLWNYHFAIFAHYLCVINESDFQSFVYYCVAPEAMFEFAVGLLRLCNFWSGEGKDLLFLTTIWKHFV
jgi:hypothetical protein